MVNMLPSVVLPLLPVLWAVVAGAFWWRQLASPWLFFLTAILALLGIQAVLTFVWDWWPAARASGYFLESTKVSAEAVQRQLEETNRAAIIQAVIVVIAAVPYLFWLKGALGVQKP